MQVQIELPEDVTQALTKHFGDLSRHTLESLAIEGYRAGVLGETQVRRMLGLATRQEANEFLYQAGLYYDYSREQMERDVEANRRALEKRDREASDARSR